MSNYFYIRTTDNLVAPHFLCPEYLIEQLTLSIIRNGGAEKFSLLYTLCIKKIIKFSDLEKLTFELNEFLKIEKLETFTIFKISDGKEICWFHQDTTIDNFLYLNSKNQYFKLDKEGLTVSQYKDDVIIDVFKSIDFTQYISVDLDKEPITKNMEITLSCNNSKAFIKTFIDLPIADDYYYINFTDYNFISKKANVAEPFSALLLNLQEYISNNITENMDIIIYKINSGDLEFLEY